MNFSEALESLKEGNYVTRKDWNGNKAGHKLYIIIVEDNRCDNHEWIGFCYDNDLQCPWTASQTDLLAEDWEVVE